MSRVRKKEDVFFTLFSDLSKKTVSAAELFQTIVHDYPDSSSRLPEMKQFELDCDVCSKSIYQTLDSSFITPFDREDIDLLARKMDDIVDGMQGVSLRYELFAVEHSRPQAIRLSDLILRATRSLDVSFDHLPEFKHDEVVVNEALKVCAVEDEGDIVYHEALGQLFHEDCDPLVVIKWKTLLDKMEDTLDSCKDAAVIIQGVVMKNA